MRSVSRSTEYPNRGSGGSQSRAVAAARNVRRLRVLGHLAHQASELPHHRFDQFLLIAVVLPELCKYVVFFINVFHSETKKGGEAKELKNIMRIIRFTVVIIGASNSA